MDLQHTLQGLVAVTAEKSGLLPQATQLASRLGLTLLDPDSQKTDHGLLLIYTAQGLVLQNQIDLREAPISVDFSSPKLIQRCQQAGAAKQTLAKAVGIKPGVRPTVIDATAGLGRDGFVLASLGCHVTLIERHPVVYELLLDGLARAQHVKYAASIVSSNIKLISANAANYISLLGEEDAPDVIYLDPMFPHREKSALVKKEMRLFQTLVGVDEDLSELINAALHVAKKRVVVKRPSKGPDIEVRKPQLTLTGKTTRYDIYFTHR